MKMKLRKCSCGGTAEIVDGEPTELGAKMLREYGLTPSRTYKAVCSSCGKSTASFPYGDEVKADWNRLYLVAEKVRQSCTLQGLHTSQSARLPYGIYRAPDTAIRSCHSRLLLCERSRS